MVRKNKVSAPENTLATEKCAFAVWRRVIRRNKLRATISHVAGCTSRRPNTVAILQHSALM